MSEDQVIKSNDTRSQISATDSQTAQDYISQQLQLEADAREALPYQFDTCTKPLGALRQSLFSCLTCNPPSNTPFTPAGICYSCSISCHGEHELVELFSKRDFECDCGTTRIAASTPCSLRSNAAGTKGDVRGSAARADNKYNQNYAGTFCGCGDEYDPTKEKGTMFQCLGLGHLDTGGCGEDWWHPECLLGLPRTPAVASEALKAQETDGGLTSVPEETVAEEPKDEAPLPAGFPAEDAFDHLVCYKCVDANPWIKQYAGTCGFLPPVFLKGEQACIADSQVKSEGQPSSIIGAKRKLEDEEDENSSKRTRVEDEVQNSAAKISKTEDQDPASNASPAEVAKHATLPTAPSGRLSLFVKDDFRNHFCRCAECFPRLSQFPQLLEEEDAYEPPVSDSDEEDGQGSVGSKSLLDRGEAALSTMDRMRAIEGVMAYNHLKDKVKAFLQPFAESGQTVGAEDVKAYFARLRGDEEAMRASATGAKGGGDGDDGDNRREQSGY